jgi:hypothetical protein
MALSTINQSSFAAGVGGKVLQVAQAVKSDTFSGAANTWHKITGLTQSITPASTSSKIFVSCQISTQDSNNYPPFFHIYRDGTKITPDGAGNPYTGNVTNAYAYMNGGTAVNAMASMTISFQFLDSPNTTSAVEYQVYGGKPSSAVSNLVINNGNFGDAGSSVITLMEIAG